jgi:hypothetical protein
MKFYPGGHRFRQTPSLSHFLLEQNGFIELLDCQGGNWENHTLGSEIS